MKSGTRTRPIRQRYSRSLPSIRRPPRPTWRRLEPTTQLATYLTTIGMARWRRRYHPRPDSRDDQLHGIGRHQRLGRRTVRGVASGAVPAGPGVASALAGTSTGTQTTSTPPTWMTNRLSHSGFNYAPIDEYFDRLAQKDTPNSPAILITAGETAEASNLHDPVLESVLANLGFNQADPSCLIGGQQLCPCPAPPGPALPP